eukprot:Skav208314  [mRNA]  locus=scaffold897:469896:474120:+ [translate_table: standard]
MYWTYWVDKMAVHFWLFWIARLGSRLPLRGEHVTCDLQTARKRLHRCECKQVRPALDGHSPRGAGQAVEKKFRWEGAVRRPFRWLHARLRSSEVMQLSGMGEAVNSTGISRKSSRIYWGPC